MKTRKNLSREKLNKYKKPASKPRKPTGFRTMAEVPPKLVKLLELKQGEHSTRPRITKQIYDYIAKSGLYDKDDNRIIRVNKALIEAFDLTPEQVKKINSTTSDRDENGLNFYNLRPFSTLS